jgi:asparagine synthase (glutamine-hydrolysing)
LDHRFLKRKCDRRGEAVFISQNNMCRIAGLFLREDPEFINAQLKKMCNALQHGGPDDEGYYIDEVEGVGFGHRRLSIIDLSSTGHQPMSNDDQKIWITFNGEIYNFLELKEELRQKGHTFKSNSDTEVVIKAYEQWGEASFNKLKGMFAFALHDQRQNLIYLVRDPSGIKPLYYYHAANQLIFASEIKAFHKTEIQFEDNNEWKILFLTFGFIPEPYTTLRDVYSLPKGSFLKYHLNISKSEIHSYYQFQFTNKITDKDEAISLIRESLITSVKRHLISDAPIGLFLSGGIDSSLLTLIASQFKKEDLYTLSVLFNEAKFSEKKYQDMIVKMVSSKHCAHLITQEEFLSYLPEILEGQDQPSNDGINTWFISKYAKEAGLKAVLSGIGADELFGGYPSFSRMKKLRYIPSFIASLASLTNDKWGKLHFLGLNDDIGKYLFLRGFFSPRNVAEILDIDQRQVIDVIQKTYLHDQIKNLRSGNKASWFELNVYMQNQLLKDSDNMSMLHGIEIRVPFLDKDFVELVLSIDEDLKFNQNRLKGLLIDSFKDILPESIYNRTKMGFTFPFQLWLNNSNVMDSMSVTGNTKTKYFIDMFKAGNLHWSRAWALMQVMR